MKNNNLDINNNKITNPYLFYNLKNGLKFVIKVEPFFNEKDNHIIYHLKKIHANLSIHA